MTASTVVITCHTALMQNYLSKVFLIVEKVEDIFVNIPERVLKQINDSSLHDEGRLLTGKAPIKPIVKTLNKIVITRDVYDKFMYIWYDERHVKPYTEQFNFLSNNVFDKFEHPDLITEWIHNMDTYASTEKL